MGTNRRSRGCLARLVLALAGLVAFWLAVAAPHWARVDVEHDASTVLARDGELSATAQSERLERLASALDAASSRADALRRFDAWRTTPVEFAGQTFVPWEAIMERSDTVRLADDAVSGALAALASLDAARDALDARAANVDALASAVDALGRWPTPSRLADVVAASAALRADLEQLRDAIAPLAEAGDELNERLAAASAWLGADGAARVLGGERMERARAAVADLLGAARTPGADLRAAVNGLNDDIAALTRIEARASSWWAPPDHVLRGLRQDS